MHHIIRYALDTSSCRLSCHVAAGVAFSNAMKSCRVHARLAYEINLAADFRPSSYTGVAYLAYPIVMRKPNTTLPLPPLLLLRAALTIHVSRIK